MRTLIVVCPVRDEEAVILAFHEELSRVLAGLEGDAAHPGYVRGPRARLAGGDAP